MKIAYYDTITNKLLGWYDTDIHTTIPTPNIEVTDTVWSEALNINANYVNIDLGILEVKDFRNDLEKQISLSNEIKTAIQNHLDDTAKLFKFETGMDRACSYTGYTNPFQADALILANWRSAIWEYVETEEAKVIAGTRTMPTSVEMLEELELNFSTPVAI